MIQQPKKTWSNRVRARRAALAVAVLGMTALTLRADPPAGTAPQIEIWHGNKRVESVSFAPSAAPVAVVAAALTAPRPIQPEYGIIYGELPPTPLARLPLKGAAAREKVTALEITAPPQLPDLYPTSPPPCIVQANFSRSEKARPWLESTPFPFQEIVNRPVITPTPLAKSFMTLPTPPFAVSVIAPDLPGHAMPFIPACFEHCEPTTTPVPGVKEQSSPKPAENVAVEKRPSTEFTRNETAPSGGWDLGASLPWIMGLVAVVVLAPVLVLGAVVVFFRRLTGGSSVLRVEYLSGRAASISPNPFVRPVSPDAPNA